MSEQRKGPWMAVGRGGVVDDRQITDVIHVPSEGEYANTYRVTDVGSIVVFEALAPYYDTVIFVKTDLLDG